MALPGGMLPAERWTVPEVSPMTTAPVVVGVDRSAGAMVAVDYAVQEAELRKRPLRVCESRVAAEPDELLASTQLAAILARAPLRQNEIELSGVERLQQATAKPDR